MCPIDRKIQEILDRRAEYGGDSYHVHVRRVVNGVIDELELEPNYTLRKAIIRQVIEALEKRGATQWGLGFRKHKYVQAKCQYLIGRIYQISG